MGPVRPIFLISAALAAAGSPSLRADLAGASPFLPPNAAAAAGQAGPSGPVELRGIMGTGSGFAYCIYDTARKTSTWVGLNEKGNDLVVRMADPTHESVTVDYQGQTLKLVLHT